MVVERGLHAEGSNLRLRVGIPPGVEANYRLWRTTSFDMLDIRVPHFNEAVFGPGIIVFSRTGPAGSEIDEYFWASNGISTDAIPVTILPSGVARPGSHNTPSQVGQAIAEEPLVYFRSQRFGTAKNVPRIRVVSRHSGRGCPDINEKVDIVFRSNTIVAERHFFLNLR